MAEITDEEIKGVIVEKAADLDTTQISQVLAGVRAEISSYTADGLVFPARDLSKVVSREVEALLREPAPDLRTGISYGDTSESERQREEQRAELVRRYAVARALFVRVSNRPEADFPTLSKITSPRYLSAMHGYKLKPFAVLDYLDLLIKRLTAFESKFKDVQKGDILFWVKPSNTELLRELKFSAISVGGVMTAIGEGNTFWDPRSVFKTKEEAETYIEKRRAAAKPQGE